MQLLQFLLLHPHCLVLLTQSAQLGLTYKNMNTREYNFLRNNSVFYYRLCLTYIYVCLIRAWDKGTIFVFSRADLKSEGTVR